MPERPHTALITQVALTDTRITQLCSWSWMHGCKKSTADTRQPDKCLGLAM